MKALQDAGLFFAFPGMKKEKNINQNPYHALFLESKKLHK